MWCVTAVSVLTVILSLGEPAESIRTSLMSRETCHQSSCKYFNVMKYLHLSQLEHFSRLKYTPINQFHASVSFIFKLNFKLLSGNEEFSVICLYVVNIFLCEIENDQDENER